VGLATLVWCIRQDKGVYPVIHTDIVHYIVILKKEMGLIQSDELQTSTQETVESLKITEFWHQWSTG